MSVDVYAIEWKKVEVKKNIGVKKKNSNKVGIKTTQTPDRIELKNHQKQSKENKVELKISYRKIQKIN